MGYTIYGRVTVEETGEGVPGLTVKAIDKDLLLDDLLGAVTTDQDGRFEIRYDPEDFRELFLDRKPDIFLKVRTPDGETIYETAVRYDAGKEETFDIRIPKDQLEKENNDMDKDRKVVLEVGFEGQPDEDVQVVAYAFDRQGNLLASAPVEDGLAHLALEEKQARRARIFLGPPPPAGGEDEMPTVEMMRRWHTYEPVWKYDPDLKIQKLLPIPPIHWKWWLWCKCRVRGRVVRPVEIGGTTEDMPVCHARVHICEVDRFPFFILRLRDDLIFRLRDELLRVVERPLPIPIPLPDPPPFRYDPGVIDPSPENIAQMNRAPGTGPFPRGGFPEAALNPQPEPPSADLGAVSINPQPEPPGLSLGVRALGPQPEPPDMPLGSTLTPEARAALSSSSVKIVRQALIDHRFLLYPYLCLWDWLPWWWHYTCDEIAVVETDGQGRFDVPIWYLCFGDHPDLYFWVEYQIGGAWTTVYEPSLRCNTYWNYACGEEVTLRVTDPRVPPCGEPPDLSGRQVAIMSIGNRVSIHEIQDSTAGADEGLTDTGQPFGGRLEPHVWFSRSVLIGAGITRYKWSYRRLTDSDGDPVADTWHVMDREVVRHYSVIDPVTSDLSFPVDVMGPDANNQFRIQPIDPPAPGIDWFPLDAREDSATAFFKTHLLEGGDAEAAAGKYELKLELFWDDGSPVNLSAESIQLKVPTVDAPFGTGTVPTVLAPEEYLIRDGSGDVVAFRLVVHVDNCPCEAEIYPVSGPGLSVDPNCGYIEYPAGADATISFKARHPNDFATFDFDIHRGTSVPIPEASASGSVGASPVNGFVRDVASVFTKVVPVDTLLTSNTPEGVEPCDKAAFAETLYVWPLATDGWDRLWYLRDHGVPSAFALAPGPSLTSTP
jgi:hypothetical protein